MESLHQSFNHPIHIKERYEFGVSAVELFLKEFRNTTIGITVKV